MAVTQQFVRISEQQLELCRRSADELDRLCSFATASHSDHLDLDWASGPLLRVGEPACVDPDVFAALRYAITGEQEVNPTYRDHPSTVWEHPITALDPAAVASVASMLPSATAAVSAALTPPDGKALALAGELLPMVEHPGEYLMRRLSALRDFYAEAARRRLAVVLWWD
ncbi:hypothetical protein ACFFMN_27170 [Planobispora siamensis]|uniref:DUF1877 family protein n=1 Tax=Planobispora siamensis TaxID=936338 RepID=A0A8J3WHJ2_9ACTN|nr:hypothetical protein [Planobispora siamensis]GIH90649.1 hypothetical protein Psi01_12790 [Planobispora siamensis]